MTETTFQKRWAQRKSDKQQQGFQHLSVFHQDLHDDYVIDPVAERLIGLCQDRLSKRLCETMKESLRGFSPWMQVQMAENMLDCTCEVSIRTTNVKSADVVLWYFYHKIQRELADANKEPDFRPIGQEW